MQSMIHIDSPHYISAASLVGITEWSPVFGNDRPLALEIGCGTGDFVVKMAADAPDVNFIAIDYYNKGCFKTCRRIERQELNNVKVLRVEARQFIVDHVPKGSLAAIYINCPDPWPKKRHRKRRLVNRQFMEFLLPYLAPGGEFTFATDFADYGLDVAGMLPGVEGMENCLAPDLYRHELPGYHLSKYMLKFLAEGHRIYFMRYRKILSDVAHGVAAEARR